MEGLADGRPNRLLLRPLRAAFDDAGAQDRNGLFNAELFERYEHSERRALGFAARTFWC